MAAKKEKVFSTSEVRKVQNLSAVRERQGGANRTGLRICRCVVVRGLWMTCRLGAGGRVGRGGEKKWFAGGVLGRLQKLENSPPPPHSLFLSSETSYL